jgi:hypothetical protein
MTTRLARALLVLLLGSAPALGACSPASENSPPQMASIARVAGVEVQHGYLIAEFADGRRMNVSMDKRALGWYVVGDQIWIDSYGRVVPGR